MENEPRACCTAAVRPTEDDGGDDVLDKPDVATSVFVTSLPAGAEKEKKAAEVLPFSHADIPKDAVAVDALAVADSARLLFIGDEEGYISKFELEGFIASTGFAPIAENKKPINLASYSARRRLHRRGDSDESPAVDSHPSHRGMTEFEKMGIGEPLPRRAVWIAHKSSINSLTIVDEALGQAQAVISCSMDMSTRLWSFDAEPLGVLTMSEEDKERILQGRAVEVPWTFSMDTSERLDMERSRSAKLLRDIEHVRSTSPKSSKSNSLRPITPKRVSHTSETLSGTGNSARASKVDSLLHQIAGSEAPSQSASPGSRQETTSFGLLQKSSRLLDQDHCSHPLAPATISKRYKRGESRTSILNRSFEPGKLRAARRR